MRGSVAKRTPRIVKVVNISPLSIRNNSKQSRKTRIFVYKLVHKKVYKKCTKCSQCEVFCRARRCDPARAQASALTRIASSLRINFFPFHKSLREKSLLNSFQTVLPQYLLLDTPVSKTPSKGRDIHGAFLACLVSE